MSLQSQRLLFGDWKISTATSFIFFSTILMYAIHRLIGLSKINAPPSKEHLKISSLFGQAVFIYAILAAIGSAYFFLHLSSNLQLSFIAPIIISALYVLPFSKSGKRLRDFHFIKIFLISIIWAWVTVLIPAQERDMRLNIPTLFIYIERALFVFAITLPFDIRDMSVDQSTSLKTIPVVIGIKRTKIIAAISIFLMISLSSLLFKMDIYNRSYLTALFISAIIFYILI